MIHMCYYGCGQEAKYQFKNGKWCCSKSQNSCPIIRKKFKDGRPNIMGKNNPMFGKHLTEEHKRGIGEKNGDRLRTSFKKIIDYVEDKGYQLLSTKEEYKNQFSYILFRCPDGHEFSMRYDNFKSGQRCPVCKYKRDSERMLNGGAAHANSFITNPSKPQVELFNLVKEDHPESILEYPCLNYSIDIVIPNLKIAIEYDGSYWHQDQEKDDKRQREIEDQGWTFLRYRDYVPSKEELRKDIFNL